MSKPLRSLTISHCIWRVKNSAGDNLPAFTSPFLRQLRGNRRSSKPRPPVNVKLLEDIRGYGRQGAIIPVAAGRMRNIWYPKGKAAYVTGYQLKSLDKQDAITARDVNFVPDVHKNGEKSGRLDRPRLPVAEVESSLLTPHRAAELLEMLLPSHLDFYRATIASTTEQETPHYFRPSAVSSSAADLTAASEPLLESSPTAIYGSVSTMDIATSIKAALAADGEGARVVLAPEDINILQDGEDPETKTGEDTDRVKAIGEFNIAIILKGAEKVRRVVRVKAQRESI